MIRIRKSDDRGKGTHSWLTSFHTFSFAEYHDPDHMRFSDLRVINEDIIQPGKGFETHPHKNMEIITYVISGELAHQDSMGTGSIIKPGEIQIMSAGTGIEHSEYNNSKIQPLHLLQIWIFPNKLELTPNYQQSVINKKMNEFILLASKDKQESAVMINQDIALYVAYLDKKQIITYSFKNERSAWLQLIKGRINLSGEIMVAGDGAAIKEESEIIIECLDEAEFLLFDLR